MSADTPKKSTVYVDVDEDITSIVDKVRSASGGIVALVLPKRANVLQSSVNMKLLKRSAKQSDKQLVLITSESSLMPLAAMAGLYVASSVNSKPNIPLVPSEPEESVVPKEAMEIQPDTTVGDVSPSKSKEEPIEIDNSPSELDKATSVQKSSGKKPKNKNKKGGPKVPNFNKFRVLMIGGIAALILLIVGWYWAYFIAPNAVVTIKGETSTVSVNFDMTADTTATSLDEESGIVPAKSEEIKKTETEKTPATGQKDLGTKASGSVSLANCTDNAVTVPAGTGVSSSGQTYITQNTVRLDQGEFNSSGQCRSSGDHVSSTQVVAQNNGDQYNAAPRAYSVAGFSGVTGQGSQMSGGSSKIIKVVSAGDIETAKQKITAKQGVVQDELKNKLKEGGYVAIADTYSAGTPKITSTPAVDSEANEVTVTSETTHSMLGVKEDDMKTLVKKSAGDQIDTEKQAILSYGLTAASFKPGAKKGTKTPMSVSTQIIAGPEINQDAIRKDVAGKKRGEAEQVISSRPGIKEVRVETKPFWIYSVTKKESKIKIVVQEADGSQLNP